MSTKTTQSARKEDVQRKWYVFDATDMVVGRAASQIAAILRGKNKAIFTPHTDAGDFVIIINADKARFTGRKMEDKNYVRFSGYPGGLTATPAGELMKKNPDRMWRRTVWGMLPKNRLSRQLITKLKVYAGPNHPHEAQRPEVLDLSQKG